MSLESLVDELRARGEADLSAVATQREADLGRIASELQGKVAQLRADAAKAADAEAARDRAQRLAAANLAARRLLYEAREEKLDEGFEEVRRLLTGLTETPDYAALLRRQLATANQRLGRTVRIYGRADDAALLGRLAGKAFDPEPRPILGGLVAETPDGRRRLDLSFDELLRQRADAVRGLLL
jgi:vacuolar-type H+-ATPase subunit E/Vma4